MADGGFDGRCADGQDWSRWRRAVFGDPYLVWHEGPDFAVLLDTARSDPATVTAMLTAGLRECDSVAALSFAALADAGLAPERAQELLHAVLPEATGTFLVRVAQALYTMTGDPSWAAPVTVVLREGRHWGERIDAAMALAGFTPTRNLAAAVARAVGDPEYLVRYHAANTLLRYAGKTGDIADRKKLFEKIKSPVAGDTSAADTLAAWAVSRLPGPAA